METAAQWRGHYYNYTAARYRVAEIIAEELREKGVRARAEGRKFQMYPESRTVDQISSSGKLPKQIINAIPNFRGSESALQIHMSTET